MLQAKTYHGAQPNMDLDPAIMRRDIRPFRYKFKDFVANYGGYAIVILAVLVLALPFTDLPQISDVLFGIGLILFLFMRNKTRHYNYRTPLTVGMNKKVAKDAGLMLLGNEVLDQTGVWFNNDDLRTHILIFGSTGSGKTRTLLSMMYQALLMGSGVMYTDGKADNTVAWLVYSLARRLGREDDLLVINYLIGGETNIDGSVSLSRLSNTTNPFAYGNPEQLRSLLVGLMRDSGGDDMWKGRASAMIAGLLKALTTMRDSGEINLDVEKIREYLPLDRVVELSNRIELPESALAPIKKYLGELPGYTEEEALMNNIQPKAYEQHGYIIMQLTEVMANLSDTYGHIFSAPLGEVDFKDVVFNRRILFCMLPALEVDPDALSGLGKLVVSAVRAALGPALGNKIEGTKQEVVDTKPTNSSVPFMLILDEYGYYSVKGFAVVAAQARSLGVSVCFAGQDYPSFKKGDEIEAQATVANTNIKVCMKLEEAQETYEVMKARAGEADQVVAESFEANGSMGGYNDGLRTRTEKVARLAIEDLVDQDPGYAFVIFRNVIKPIKMFYADPIEVEEAELNKFIMVDRPKKDIINNYNKGHERLESIFGLKVTSETIDNNVNTDKGIVTFIEDFKALRNKNESIQESSIASIGMIEYRSKVDDRDLARKSGIDSKLDESIENDIYKTKEMEAKNISRSSEAPVFNKEDKVSSELDELNDSIGLGDISVPNYVSENGKETLNLEVFEGKDVNSVEIDAKRVSQELLSLFEDTVIGYNESISGQQMTMAERLESTPAEQMKETVISLGLDENEASELSDEYMDDMLSLVNTYPVNDKPEKVSKDRMDESIMKLMNKINLSS